MSVLIPLIAILVFVVASLAWKIRDDRRIERPSREFLRAGEPEVDDGTASARQAMGTAAWTRTSDSAGI